tara:strand:- start:49 stop:201 length:153 start_codon:yes stop_codon:yes gene_type:complete
MALSKRAKARMKVATASERKTIEKAAKTLFNNELMGVKRMNEIVRWSKKC